MTHPTSKIRTYRKKPIDVKAYLWEGDINLDLPAGTIHSIYEMSEGHIYGKIRSREGELTIRAGEHYIVGPGAKGEYWPVEREIFEATYEEFSGDSSAPETSTPQVRAAHRAGTEPLSRIIGDLEWCLVHVQAGHPLHPVLTRVIEQLRGSPQETSAGIAQLVERDASNVDVASSSLAACSNAFGELPGEADPRHFGDPAPDCPEPCCTVDKPLPAKASTDWCEHLTTYDECPYGCIPTAGDKP